MLLTRNIRFADILRTVPVEIEHPECTVLLRELTVSQLSLLDNDIPKQLAMMIVDETGTRIFTTAEDIENLRQMNAGMSTRLMIAAAKLNGVGQAAVDETVKNLLASPNVGSVSD